MRLQEHYASYTDDEPRQIVDWLSESGETCVTFNHIPRGGDSRRVLEMIGGAK